MKKILFICHGNICRSPLAEYIFKKMVADAGLTEQFVIDSAATSREEIDNDIYPPAKTCLKEHGIPFGRHHAKQITKEMIEEFDYVIAMEQYNINNMIRQFGESDKYSLLLDYTDSFGDISDPWYSGEFETAYNEIVCGCKGLMEYLKKWLNEKLNSIKSIEVQLKCRFYRFLFTFELKYVNIFRVE